MTEADNETLRLAILKAVDDACWTARKWFGHDDNGLDDYGSEVDGVEYHPSAVNATDAIMAALACTERSEP